MISVRIFENDNRNNSISLGLFSTLTEFTNEKLAELSKSDKEKMIKSIEDGLLYSPNDEYDYFCQQKHCYYNFKFISGKSIFDIGEGK